MGLSFTIVAGPRRQVLVPRYSWPHFTPSDSRLPQPGGPGLRVYIAQEQGGPVIPPDTGFPFRRLLRLTGLRWRCSTSPQHGMFKPQMPCPRYIISPWTSQKHRFQEFLYFVMFIRFSGNVLIESLPSIISQYNDKWTRVGSGLEGRDRWQCEVLSLPLLGEMD
jgi:hypothetical protein